MTFNQFVSTTNPLNIPLYNKQQRQKQTKPLYELQINELLQDVNHYVSEIIIIDQDIICTVTKCYLDFYSITINNQKSESYINGETIIEGKRFIGRLRVDQAIGVLLVNEHTQQEQQVTENKQQVNQTTEHKQPNIHNISIIQHKGIIYHNSTKTFYMLLQTTTNKYLVTFQILLPSSSILQSLSNRQQRISIMNFMVIYDFSNQSSKVKYNLQLNPEILFLPKSQGLILVRKFYSDSFVVIFKPQKYLKTPDNNIQNHLQQHQQLPIYYKPYWSFYINEQCLSSLDDKRFLVNYRQLITRNYLEIDILDLRHREKIALKIVEGIQPMTIKAVQLLSEAGVEKLLQGNGQQGEKVLQEEKQDMIIRVFSILKRSESTYIIDYNITHNSVIRTYKINNFFMQKVSFYDQSKQHYFVNYIYQERSWIGALGCGDLRLIESEENGNEKQAIQKQQLFCNKLVTSSVQHEMDSFSWNMQSSIVLQSQISVTTNSLQIKLSKLYNKQLHYIKIIDEVKQTLQPLQDIQFSIKVLQLLTRSNINNDKQLVFSANE